jgi:hypothetical protein
MGEEAFAQLKGRRRGKAENRLKLSYRFAKFLRNRRFLPQRRRGQLALGARVAHHGRRVVRGHIRLYRVRTVWPLRSGLPVEPKDWLGFDRR